MNGDLGENATKFAAGTYGKQLRSEAAHGKHHMVSALQSQVQVSEGELLHAPVGFSGSSTTTRT